MDDLAAPTKSYSLFHGEVDGQRPAALLFHGLTGSPDEMRDLAAALHARGFDIVVPCLAGHERTIDEMRFVRAERWMNDAQQALLALRKRNPSAIAIVGLSFGSLLSLFLATCSREDVRVLVMLSPPLELRARWKHYGLRWLSFLPDSILDRLGLVVKTERPPGIFVRPRDAFDAHSIAALARAKFIERISREPAKSLRIPVLAIQDPSDHHLRANSTQMLQLMLPNADFHQRWFPGGEHELTMGPRCREVVECVTEFLCERIQGSQCPEN